ncbi:hypothetical protein E0E54_14505 [Azotobacter chroococcum]|nr:cellulose biosynthesis protein BcsR [Azotobacter chroococcum]TBW34096.1 hypothetical protein E0E54_14505 [Azotobacter chroococcum]
MHGRVRMKRNNDIANLKEALRLPGLAYVDCAARQELRLALQRWPLLAELLAVRGVEP